MFTIFNLFPSNNQKTSSHLKIRFHNIPGGTATLALKAFSPAPFEGSADKSLVVRGINRRGSQEENGCRQSRGRNERDGY